MNVSDAVVLVVEVDVAKFRIVELVVVIAVEVFVVDVVVLLVTVAC